MLSIYEDIKEKYVLLLANGGKIIVADVLAKLAKCSTRNGSYFSPYTAEDECS